MIVMSLQNIQKNYGSTEILKNISLEVKARETIGIVGGNGAGKTTLMKIMADELSYDGGHISTPKDISIGYLTQEMSLESDKTVLEEMNLAFKDVLKAKDDIDEVTKWLTDHEYTHPDYEENVKRLEYLQNFFEQHNGYTIDVEIKTVITGLNFSLEDLHRPISEFSGGQKTRLQLGKMLLYRPDILLLDEPTNHLDLETVEWLENYLNRYTGSVVVISHDRFFLDRIVDKIYEIEFNEGTLYHGDYTDYQHEKQKTYERQLKMYERQQKEIQRLEDFVDRNIARASTSGMAKSRRKMLEHMDRIDSPTRDTRQAKFHFDIEKESGNDVLRVKDLAIGYDDVLNEKLNFFVEKEDRLLVLGPNGIGKSTLIKTIAKKLPKISGEITYGTNVSIGYYDQKQAEFYSRNTILEELWKEYPHFQEQDIRKILGQFLFTQDDVNKHIYQLSGGEKARIQLAKLMLQKNNLLLLDEPTNHLDIQSKEMLESALMNYPGTIIAVSHDRYFIKKLANRIMEMDVNKTKIINGDYDYYLHKKEEENAQLLFEENKVEHVTNDDYERQKERRSIMQKLSREGESLEKAIEEIELKIEKIETEMTNPEVFNDFEKVNELNELLNDLKEKLEENLSRWEEIELELAEFE